MTIRILAIAALMALAACTPRSEVQVEAACTEQEWRSHTPRSSRCRAAMQALSDKAGEDAERLSRVTRAPAPASRDSF